MFSVLAIVGARGGSKRVPGKNLRHVGGRPLIEWTFDVASSSPSISRVILSTDAEEIAMAGRRAGIEVPFRRPAELSGDTATSEAFVIHALDWLEEHEVYRPDAVMLLQPTSPLRVTADVEAALSLFRAKEADVVVSVGPSSAASKCLRRVMADGRLREWAEGTPASETFALNGAIYIARPEVLRNRGVFDGDNAFAYLMPRARSLDVDHEEDLQLADAMLSR